MRSISWIRYCIQVCAVVSQNLCSFYSKFVWLRIKNTEGHYPYSPHGCRKSRELKIRWTNELQREEQLERNPASIRLAASIVGHVYILRKERSMSSCGQLEALGGLQVASALYPMLCIQLCISTIVCENISRLPGRDYPFG